MTVIRQQDFIDSIEDALQFISYYHPLDYVKAVEEAYKKEKSQAKGTFYMKFLCGIW